MPSNSGILATYPDGVELSCTAADLVEITADGSWVFGAGVVCPGKSQFSVAEGGTFTVPAEWDNWKSYGTKITTAGTMIIDSVTYAPGAFLTVDGSLNWVEVSGWD